MNTRNSAPKYIEIVISKATTMLRGNSIFEPFYKNMVGERMFVKKSNQRTYYETKSGESVLISDCKPVN